MQLHNVKVQITFNITLDQWAWNREHAIQLAEDEGFDIAKTGDGSGPEFNSDPACKAVDAEQLYELSPEQIAFILEAADRPEQILYDDDPDDIIDSLNEAGLILHREDRVSCLGTYAIFIAEMIHEREQNNEPT